MTRENTFRFKQFAVLNDKTAMKVGTDGVLLGAWCDLREAKSVLDVGTGCGLIALMIAQRNADCDIDCIDIDEGAIEEARINADNSPWSDRIHPFMAEEEITKSCAEVGAYVHQKVVIYTKPGKEPKRCLWEILKHNSDKRCSELFVQNSDGQYSEQYIGLCKDFYMNM